MHISLVLAVSIISAISTAAIAESELDFLTPEQRAQYLNGDDSDPAIKLFRKQQKDMEHLRKELAHKASRLPDGFDCHEIEWGRDRLFCEKEMSLRNQKKDLETEIDKLSSGSSAPPSKMPEDVSLEQRKNECFSERMQNFSFNRAQAGNTGSLREDQQIKIIMGFSYYCDSIMGGPKLVDKMASTLAFEARHPWITTPTLKARAPAYYLELKQLTPESFNESELNRVMREVGRGNAKAATSECVMRKDSRCR